MRRGIERLISRKITDEFINRLFARRYKVNRLIIWKWLSFCVHLFNSYSHCLLKRGIQSRNLHWTRCKETLLVIFSSKISWLLQIALSNFPDLESTTRSFHFVLGWTARIMSSRTPIRNHDTFLSENKGDCKGKLTLSKHVFEWQCGHDDNLFQLGCERFRAQNFLVAGRSDGVQLTVGTGTLGEFKN